MGVTLHGCAGGGGGWVGRVGGEGGGGCPNKGGSIGQAPPPPLLQIQGDSGADSTHQTATMAARSEAGKGAGGWSQLGARRAADGV